MKFKIDYAGGWGAFRKPSYWKTFRNACRRYDGPDLVGFIGGCKAPDGSYWALQKWVRLEAMRGFAPFKKAHTDVELHISHWTGALPLLEVWRNWTYGGRLQGFFGRLSYDGEPVYGTRSPSRTVADPFARNVYIAPSTPSTGAGGSGTRRSTHTSETEASATRSSHSRRPAAIPGPKAAIRAMSHGDRASASVTGSPSWGPA